MLDGEWKDKTVVVVGVLADEVDAARGESGADGAGPELRAVGGEGAGKGVWGLMRRHKAEA